MGTVKMLLFKILPFLSLAAADYWPNLRVTFGLNPFGNAFYPYPITESEAIAAGWEKIGTCGDPIWLGERYADPSDPALVLIYDQAGYIAGSQSGMLASNVDESVFPVSSNPVYQAGDFYGVPAFFSTAYFVDTAIICNGGRSESDFSSQGVGDRLLFQSGSTPDSLIVAPMTQDAANNDPAWYDHYCFLGMGDHYLQFNYQPDQDCNTVFPGQLLYDAGVLNGFVWQHAANLPGDKWEHPDAMAVNAIIDRPPTCISDLLEYPGLSTMHHYFYSMPWLTLCPFKQNRGDLPEYKDAMMHM